MRNYSIAELRVLSRLYTAMPVSEFLDMLEHGQRYYELYTFSHIGNYGYYTYLTESKLNSEEMQKEIQNLKDGKYTVRFGYLKELTEAEYLERIKQHTAQTGKP